MDPHLSALELKLKNEFLNMKQKYSKNEFIEKFTSDFEAIKSIVESNKAEILSRKFSPQLNMNSPQQVINNWQNVKTDQFQVLKPEPLIKPQKLFESNYEKNNEIIRPGLNIEQERSGFLKIEINRPDEMNSKSDFYIQSLNQIKPFTASSQKSESQMKIISNPKIHQEEEKLFKPTLISKSSISNQASNIHNEPKQNPFLIQKNTKPAPVPVPVPQPQVLILPKDSSNLSKTISPAKLSQPQPSSKLIMPKLPISLQDKKTEAIPSRSQESISESKFDPKISPCPINVMAALPEPAKPLNFYKSPVSSTQAQPRLNIEPNVPPKPSFIFNADTPSFELNFNSKLRDSQIKAPEQMRIPGIPVLSSPPGPPSPPIDPSRNGPQGPPGPPKLSRPPVLIGSYGPSIPQAASLGAKYQKNFFSSLSQNQPKNLIPGPNLFQRPTNSTIDLSKSLSKTTHYIVSNNKIIQKEENDYLGNNIHRPQTDLNGFNEQSSPAPAYNKYQYDYSKEMADIDYNDYYNDPQNHSNYIQPDFNEYNKNRDKFRPNYENHKKFEPYSQFTLGSKNYSYPNDDLDEDIYDTKSQFFYPHHNFPSFKPSFRDDGPGGYFRNPARNEFSLGHLNYGETDHFRSRLNFCSSSDDELTYENLVELEYDLYNKGNGFDDETVAKLRLEEYREDFEDKLCVVCQNVFCINESVARLKCSHLFHTSCIQEWLTRKKRCPMSCELKKRDFN